MTIHSSLFQFSCNNTLMIDGIFVLFPCTEGSAYAIKTTVRQTMSHVPYIINRSGRSIPKIMSSNIAK